MIVRIVLKFCVLFEYGWFFISKLLQSLVDDEVLELVHTTVVNYFKNNKFPFSSSNVTFLPWRTILISDFLNLGKNYPLGVTTWVG